MKIMNFTFLLLLFLILSINVYGNDTTTNKIIITEWITAGPFVQQLPVFNDFKGNAFGIKEILSFDEVDISNWWIRENDLLEWDNNLKQKWIIKRANVDEIYFEQTDDFHPQIYYAVIYLDTKRWLKASLEIESCQMLKVFLNGKEISSKSRVDSALIEDICKKGKTKKEIELERGKHIVVVKSVFDPASSAVWNLSGNISFDSKNNLNDLEVTTSPEYFLSLKNVLDDPRPGAVSISPDGNFAAVTITKSNPVNKNYENWIELYETKSGKLIQTYKGGMQLSGFQWSPKRTVFSYLSREKNESTLWIVDLTKGSSTELLKGIKDFSQYNWSPTGDFIIYSVTDKEVENKTGLKKLSGLPDRQPNWRNKNFLYIVNYPYGTSRRLTTGELTTSLNSISSNGKKLLFTRINYDLTERPYTKTTYYILDLESMQVDSLLTGNWSGTARWSPDMKKILFTGGPSLFGNVGINIPDDFIPNEYDTQAYIYDLTSKEVESITNNFDPSINNAYWSEIENAIYFTSTDKAFNHLYRYSFDKNNFERIHTNVDMINSISFAKNKPLAVFTGMSANQPPKTFFIDLAKKDIKLLADPNADEYENIKSSSIKEWTFNNRNGFTIDGMLYYPPDFDSTKKYPCIVYFYGGASPVSREFEGRYPRNYWTSNGYIVYVVQPSGATGYGQLFSALHVNDWGKTAGEDIIEGVEKLLEAHSYIDKDKLGCIGASYGGFMTLYLLTQTDIFTAAVSHAGISSLASYWGDGYWGYLYSAIATANSFPWNRKDIYVDQSPLFNADKINTPLLLLHGASDTNVPKGESTQIYTALKLLGKDVEYIKVEGQDHHILDYAKRILWSKSIVAWFDYKLKGEEEWWNSLFNE